MNVNLHIERIILKGIDLPAHHYALFQQAVQAELSRLFAEGGLQPRLLGGGALRETPGADVTVSAKPDPTDFGRQVARAVYGGISQ
jgi:hypothetical protein